jgi:hypothetical protein
MLSSLQRQVRAKKTRFAPVGHNRRAVIISHLFAEKKDTLTHHRTFVLFCLPVFFWWMQCQHDSFGGLGVCRGQVAAWTSARTDESDLCKCRRRAQRNQDQGRTCQGIVKFSLCFFVGLGWVCLEVGERWYAVGLSAFSRWQLVSVPCCNLALPWFAPLTSFLDARQLYARLPSDLIEQIIEALANPHSRVPADWRSTLMVGSRLDVLDTRNTWLSAQIVQVVQSEKLLIAYDGWQDKWVSCRSPSESIDCWHRTNGSCDHPTVCRH